MTIQELEARLKTLEDMEEINKLQRAYGYYLEHWEGQQIVDLFSNSPNVSVEANRNGVYVGQEGIKYFFLTDKLSPEFLHEMMQLSGIVDVDPGGKTAKGRWYGFGPQAMPIEGVFRALWVLGVYENEYVKEDGKWKFKKIQYSIIFCTPYEDGWVKTPTMPPPQFRCKEGPKPGPSSCYKPYPSGYVLPYHYKNPVSGK
jgi:hypothetical protein